MMNLNLDAMKSDTVRKKEIRRYIGKILMDALVAERGAENVVYIPKTVEVGENAVKITGDSIAVCVGTITNKEGYVVDAVVIVGMTVKNWNDVARKDDKVTLAINMDDIRDAVKGLEQPFSPSGENLHKKNGSSGMKFVHFANRQTPGNLV